jgi:hypothetical protein
VSALQVCLVCQNAFADARETGARLPSAPRKASRALPLPALFASATILMPVSADTDASLWRCCNTTNRHTKMAETTALAGITLWANALK